MSKERFRPSYNIFGNNNNSTVVKEESESVSPFNIHMLQTKQESYTSPILDLSESISLQSETDLSFESTLEQESPFRMIQYTETQEPEQYSSFQVPTNITMDSCVIPENEKPIEGIMGIPQAPPFFKDAYWPLVSSEPPIVAYRKQGGGSTRGVSPEGRQFMALRKHYENNIFTGKYKYHGAIDLYAKPNDPVIAIEDGEIINFIFFYLGTWGIFVKHRNVTVIYGEVSGDSLVFAGLAKKMERFIASSSRPPIPVKAGQVIGRVVRNTSYNRSSMLHVEMFANNYYRKPPWMKGSRNPHRGLYDPSLALLKLARCGKRGSGRPQTSLPSSSSPSKESIDLMRAVHLNRDYSVKLGWEKYRDKIGSLLGFTNSSPTEEVFAEAVANWQNKQGLKPDGILGPTTWSRIKLEIGKAVSSSGVDSKTIGNIDRYYGMINEEATKVGINPNLVRGIIAAESGGNPNTGKGTKGYKGLMQSETTEDQLDPRTSIRAGVNKYLKFRRKVSEILSTYKIDPQTFDQREIINIVMRAYNAGPGTVAKAIQYAKNAGMVEKWKEPEFY
jgi:hypothetical protein